MSANDTETRRPKQFLADLVRAMGEAARAARQETVEQCQSDAKAYTERLRAGTNSGAAELHKAAVADVGTIRDQSKAAAERIRIETEARISRRNRQLEDDLAEYQAVVEAELHRVGERVQAFEAEVAQFFEQLRQGNDPLSFVTIAAHMPNPLAFVDPDPGAFVHDLRLAHSQATPEEARDQSRMDPATSFAPRAHSKPRSGQT